MALNYIRLRFHCRARDTTLFPTSPASPREHRLAGYKGALLHRAWGGGLKAVDPRLHALLNPVAGNQGAPSTPNPYVFAAPEDGLDTYPRGHAFSFDLGLFGAACEIGPTCIEAVRRMGERGWGEPAVPFDLLAVAQHHPDAGWRPMLDLETGVWMGRPQARRLSELAPPTLAGQATVRFLSPAELQDNGRVLRQAPTFAQLIRAITGRAQQLASNYAGVALLDGAEKSRLRELAQDIRLSRDDTDWIGVEDRGRHGSRTFHGLIGAAAYRGDFTPFLPWLALAELTHIGKKTSYGFGRIEIGA